jgi:hypothetical protein
MKRLLVAGLLALAASFAQAATNQEPAAINGCIYSAAGFTLSTGQHASFSCDQNGNLKIAGTFSLSLTNYAQETGGNLASIVADIVALNSKIDALNVLVTTGNGYGASLAAGLLIPPIQMTLPTTPTIAAGNGEVPAASSEAGAAVTPVPSASLDANHVIKGSAGNLYSFEVAVDTTLSVAPWWIMLYNATSAPGDGAVTPLKCYAMPSNTTQYSAAFNIPVRFSTGITIGVSTTGCFTKTASTHAFISGDAQ